MLSKVSRNSRSYSTLLRRETLNPNILRAEYAVRGRVLIQADKYNEQLRSGDHNLPFDEITYCNIGNPQQLRQQPLTFNRNVISCVLSKDLMEYAQNHKVFKPDVIRRAQRYLDGIDGNSGAYTHSQGLSMIRQDVADFINTRDELEYNFTDPSRIFLTDGASPACQMALKAMIRGRNDGIMIPIPQYPLYSASIELFGGTQVPYELDEERAWGLNVLDLEDSYQSARKNGKEIRALVVINPGNPTGQVMTKENMEQVIEWCHRRQVVLMADEVYQENVYAPNKKFYSFRKVAHGMGRQFEDELQLLSFHSVSKGFLGECGRRGGYVEISNNIPQDVVDEFYKMASVNLCPNVDGQLTVALMVNPPKEGDESYDQYKSERDSILKSLGRRAKRLVSILNSLPGVTCADAEGAMYAFPQIQVPDRAITEAQRQGMTPDLFYVLSLLEATGICVVPGAGFGQKDGTYHFRTTFLPPEEDMEKVGKKLVEFHTAFMNQWG
uniref:Aminotransferase class I/classII large domain-containing protein n=1 Tax=Percolomonas cosmopolitus TaxID=63605 RepID=A0A7S1KMG0_9EUKA|eukprot:CAMPEP_0117440320 /NCGR_PEP_ID=MMETSP0759-20121206/3026_1 /TAXON_ID=63605 /ORGANISM="Percolomonas cosmopolitus, Strain WS" /LENGTH=496 /DNA_ID=CAMNT_0005232075 /DNA_START=316 /DNA_END=1806 /DNA_ORIENTATION=+